MDSKLSIHLPTITEDNINAREPDISESPTSESSLSLSSFDSSDPDCDDGKLKIPGNSVYRPGSGPKTAPVTSLNRTMFCFTRSISALNTMTFSMGVLRAKNAFMKKLSQDHMLTPADYKAEGNKQWQDIADGHKVTLIFADMDFSDLQRDEPDTPVKNVKGNLPFKHLQKGIPPPPAPPPEGLRAPLIPSPSTPPRLPRARQLPPHSLKQAWWN